MTPARLAVIALAALAAFAALAAAVSLGALDRADVAIAIAVHRLDAPPADAAMLAASWIGENPIVVTVLAGIAALAIVRRRRAVAIALVIDAVVVLTANGLLKALFARDRPRLFDKVPLPSDHGFPSGHAMSAMALYGAIAAALIALYPRARRPIAVAAAVLIGAIGVSRIYLGVHWPSDVAGGLLAGVPSLALAAFMMREYRSR